MSAPAPQESARAAGRPGRSLLLLTIAALLCAAGYGYYRFVYYPTTPQYALDRLIDSSARRDYAAVYSLIRLSGPLKALVPGPKELQSLAEQYPGVIPEVEDHRYIRVERDGDRATVTAELTTRAGEDQSTNRVDFRLVRTEGVWQVDGNWIAQELIRRGFAGFLLGGTQ